MIKQKIVFDARMINNSGIGRYIEKILLNTLSSFENIILLGDEQVLIEKLKRSDIPVINFTDPFYSISEQINYPRIIPECDLFWSPHLNIPLLPIKAKKRLTTLHDVYHLAFYDTLTIAQKIYAKIVIKAALEKSNSIITVSHFSKAEILKYTNIKYRSKIHVIHNGIDDFATTTQESTILKYENYFLAVGNIKPHKNFRRTIEAYKIFINNNLHEENIPPFLIIGKIDGLITGDNSAFDIIKDDELLKKHVHFIGRVSDDELKIAYEKALALIFPSYYEGFGFPPLEAMLNNTPVLASNTACIPEICEKAALYFDPYDIKDIAKKMDLIYKEPSLRENIRKEALMQVAKFKWSNAAAHSIKIIEDLFENRT